MLIRIKLQKVIHSLLIKTRRNGKLICFGSFYCFSFVCRHLDWVSQISASHKSILLLLLRKCKFSIELNFTSDLRYNRRNVASRIKNINFGFTHIHRCVLALYTQYFRELCEKNYRLITHDLCILKQCLTN